MNNLLKSIFLTALLSCPLTAIAHSNEAELVEDAEKVLVKLNKPEQLPAEIKLTKIDGSVFFVNATQDSPITLEVEFGSKKGHCATGNLKWLPDEKKIRSVEPVAPRNFAGLCFPDSGSYPVSIYGLKKDGSVSKTVVVAP